MSKDWYEDVHILSGQLRESREAIERLAEFASEQASNSVAYKEGMTNNFGRVMELLNELDVMHLAHEGCGRDEVSMWRQLCHSRAVQLNEAYEKIAKLEDELQRLRDYVGPGYIKHFKEYRK